MPVQTTDIPNINADGIDFNGNSQTWMIAPGVTVASDTEFGVFSAFSSSILINHGAILSVGSGLGGVWFDGTTSLAVNAADGTITGYNGIVLNGTSDSAINFGSIIGTNIGVQFDFISRSASFDNRSLIFSTDAGTYDNSDFGGNTITNSGTIEGLGYGLIIDLDAPGLFTTVINSGTLRGGIDAIIQFPGHQGALHLTNTGTLIGGIAMLGIGDNDVVVNFGHIAGPVNLGGGSDVFNGASGTSGPIDGGLGDDTLTGGPGGDQFVFDTTLGPTNIDRITNFKHHIDKIDLSHAIFTNAGAIGTLTAAAFFEGAHAHDASDRIVYNPTNGSLTYDSNGSAAGGLHHFATLALHLTLTNADFLVVA